MDNESSRGGSFDPEPDWARWKRRNEWRIDDATCLLVSADPGGSLGRWIKERWHWDESKIESELRSSPQSFATVVPTKLRAIVKAAVDIRDCAETSIGARVLVVKDRFEAYQIVSPKSWVTWAAGKGYEIPPALADLVSPVKAKTPSLPIVADWFAGGVTSIDAAYDKRLAGSSDVKTGELESTASGETKRLATLQKLVLAMAKEKYGWSSSSDKNPATGTKSGSIYSHVIKHLGDSRRVSEDTIRLAQYGGL
jgi:hypothetical protein